MGYLRRQTAGFTMLAYAPRNGADMMYLQPKLHIGWTANFWHGLLSLASKRERDESWKTVQKQDIKFY